MSNEISIIISLSLIIFGSPLLSKFLRIPTIPIEIILGSIAVSLGFIADNHIFDLVAELGFLYLMFLAGLEINLQKLFKVPVRIIQKAFLYTMILYLLSAILAYYFNLANIFIVTLPLISIGLLAALKRNMAKLLGYNLLLQLDLLVRWYQLWCLQL